MNILKQRTCDVVQLNPKGTANAFEEETFSKTSQIVARIGLFMHQITDYSLFALPLTNTGALETAPNYM